jgi:putative membrane protein
MNLHQYPFSAHVVEHLLLALIIPPLLLLVTPAFPLGRFAKLERLLGHPPVSWILGVGAMLLWHIPVLFNAAMSSDALHVFENLSFLVTGAIFWWPILSPLAARRLSPLAAVTYLFSACSSCTLLGAYLTFGPAGLYAAHHMGPDARADQQLGGLLMWIPGCFIYLSAILATVRKWYGEETAA